MTNGAGLYGKSLGFPPRVGPDGRMVWSEGETNIRESIRIILKTGQRERLNLPGFGAGLDSFLFEPNTVATRHAIEERIRKSLAQWEPRIALVLVALEADPKDGQSAIAIIEYKLVATQLQERITVSVTLGG